MSDWCKDATEGAVRDCADQLGGVVIRLREELKMAQASPPCCSSWPVQFAEFRLHMVEGLKESLDGFLERGGLHTPEQMKKAILDRLRSVADDLESAPVVDTKVEESAPN